MRKSRARGSFTRSLLEDLQALEIMLAEGRIESGVRRIGAEQELFLVDRAMRPALTALAVLGRLAHPQATSELGLFNLELNLTPRLLGGDSLRRMEQEAEGLLELTRQAASAVDTLPLLSGSLPTIKPRDLRLSAMTPAPRYRALNRAAIEAGSGRFHMYIKGLDELDLTHDSVMFEAANASFQVHLQVGADEFAGLYNLAQAISAPVLAAAVNSPVFLQRRLWHESRVALFQQAVDARSEAHRARAVPPRVSFGDGWVERSVLEIFRADIARFRVFLPQPLEHHSLAMLARGEVPPLDALRVHNGTVYRWNRPCYGVLDGIPHLRIEHRALPSGPTVLDEISNAAFFCGLMVALGSEYGDLPSRMAFDDAKSNFMAAARYGLDARLRWVGGEVQTAQQLILGHLLPLARQGLVSQRIDSADVDRYLGVIEDRVRAGRTGAQWALDSLAAMGDREKPDERYRALAACMHEQSIQGHPVHAWPLARLDAPRDLRAGCRFVEQIMTTDLFTVRSDDLVDLAASLMDWKHIRHVPVEDRRGRLVGLVSHRQLLRLVGRHLAGEGEQVAVGDIMTRDPVTVHPDTPTHEAIETMRRHRVSCLPVVDADRRLVGIVSERDFIHVAAQLLDDLLRDED